jgi:probable F420-dependent oxidoreductase
MHFGIAFANIGPFGTPEGAVAMGRAAEAAGFDSVWTVEHVLVPKGYRSEYPYDKSGRMPGAEDVDLTDPLIWLTWVGAHTTSLKLATGILILPQRNPAVVAKEVATLDRLSAGRVLLGVGAGWLEEEFAALDVPFDSRGARFDAYIDALRALWTQSPASLTNDFVDYREVYSRPAPVAGTVPIIVGGHSKVAARRAGRVGDGFFPGTGDVPTLVDVMRQAAADAGRDPEAIEVTASHPGIFGDDKVAAVEEARAMGVHRLIIPPLSFRPDAIGDALGTFGESVIAKVQA